MNTLDNATMHSSHHTKISLEFIPLESASFATSAQSKRVLLGMSGGVDSSTSAHFLQQEGFEVVGVTCIFLDNAKTQTAIADAQKVAAQLGIEHHVLDCTEGFRKHVLEYFVQEYTQGGTPSPCVVCNVYCKFPELIAAADRFNCDYVATGHYARLARVKDTQRIVVLQASDDTKDQTYMLSQLKQEQLERIVFPLGLMRKDEVRKEAASINLEVAHKEESQDICFVEDRYENFLKTWGVVDTPGDICDIDGKKLGSHQGLFHYTLGQRKGIGLAAPEPYYVLDKNVEKNQLLVGFKSETLVSHVIVQNPNWLAFESIEALGSELCCKVKLRYRSNPSRCTVRPLTVTDLEALGINAQDYASTEGLYLVVLDTPAQLTAPGQYAVFYEDNALLGGALIHKVIRAGCTEE